MSLVSQFFQGLVLQFSRVFLMILLGMIQRVFMGFMGFLSKSKT